MIPMIRLVLVLMTTSISYTNANLWGVLHKAKHIFDDIRQCHYSGDSIATLQTLFSQEKYAEALAFLQQYSFSITTQESFALVRSLHARRIHAHQKIKLLEEIAKKTVEPSQVHLTVLAQILALKETNLLQAYTELPHATTIIRRFFTPDAWRFVTPEQAILIRRVLPNKGLLWQ